MHEAKRILTIFIAICMLCILGSASEGLPTFAGNPAACAWYTNTGISNPFARSFPENLGAMGSRGLYVYDTIDIFAKSSQAHLIHKHCHGGNWDNWEIIDTNYDMASSPSVFQRGPNDIIVAFKGYRPNEQISLIIMEWNGRSWTQSNQGDMPGGNQQTTDAPAITSSNPNSVSGILNGLDVFVTSLDGEIWHKTLGISTAWEDLGMPSSGALTSAPAAASWGPGRIDIVARGYNNAYYHKSLDGGHWSDWQSLGGMLTSDPSASSVPMFQGAGGSRGLGIEGRGADGAVWGMGYHPDGSTSNWISVGGRIASGSAPALINYIGDHATVFARGMDNMLWYVDYDLGCCNNPNDYSWEQVPDNSPPSSSPVVVAGSGVSVATGVPVASLSTAVPISPVAVATAAITLEDNTDRQGMDYQGPIDLAVADPGQCRQLCLNDPNCHAYTYVRPGYQGLTAKCYLKSGIPQQTPNACCVSGAKMS